MDEPLSNLDAKLRAQMRAELKHLQHELQVTTIYVTHDQIEAMTLAHRVAVMNKGVIEQLGTPKEIYNDPRTLFVAGFIGSPPMNLVAGRGEGRRVRQLAASGSAASAAPTCRQAVLGVRPEDVHVADADDADVNLVAPIYSVELTGENTLVSVRLRRPTDDVACGQEFCRQIRPDDRRQGCDQIACFLFNGETQARVDF